MLSFYQQFADSLRQGAVVLATIVDVKGSAPREVGATMVVRSDESLIGTIGGGAGEAKVIQQALRVLESGEKQFVEIDLSGAAQRETQGVCGGTMQVWLERWQGESALNLVNQILALLNAGKTGILVTPFEPERSPYLEFSSYKNEQQQPSSFIPHSSSFLNYILPPPTLLIVGAGHCAVPLASIAHLAGFRVVVQDDRPEFAHVKRFPTASAVYAQSSVAVMPALTNVAELYAALVTRGYLQDLAALEVLLQRQMRYIGMIGSEKRVKTVYQALRQKGISPDLLQQIYAPIGLDIGALSPEEIAISICAELIKVRRGGTGLSLSAHLRKRMSESKLPDSVVYSDSHEG